MLLYGIVAGTGLGLMYVPAVVAVGYYFEKKRAFATGTVNSFYCTVQERVQPTGPGLMFALCTNCRSSSINNTVVS